MKNKKFASFLAAAAALVLLAMPAFAADEQTELPASEAAEVQQEQTAAPAEQETALPADAQTDGEPEPQLTYVALGDSIAAGVGLPGVLCTPTESGLDYSANFEGYPAQSYTALVAQGLGLDRQHAIDLGLPGLMSADLLDMVQNSGMSQPNQATGSTYTYPQFQDYLRKADIISIQIGSNDATVPCVMGLGEATHWKSEKLVELTVSGDLRNFSLENLQAMTNALRQLRLTPEETRDTNRLLFHGMDVICRDAYTQVTTNLPLILAGDPQAEPGRDHPAGWLVRPGAPAARMEPLFLRPEPLCQRACRAAGGRDLRPRDLHADFQPMPTPPSGGIGTSQTRS